MIEIVNYAPSYQQAFKTLNEAWITKYFVMEESDRKALEQPDEYIVKPGGHIFIALSDNEPVGTCALIRMTEGIYDFELAKMAVDSKAQGKGIGWELGRAAVKRAKECHATRLYLESNSALRPAVTLYRKLGFRDSAARPSPYSRCDVQMELLLDEVQYL